MRDESEAADTSRKGRRDGANEDGPYHRHCEWFIAEHFPRRFQHIRFHRINELGRIVLSCFVRVLNGHRTEGTDRRNGVNPMLILHFKVYELWDSTKHAWKSTAIDEDSAITKRDEAMRFGRKVQGVVRKETEGVAGQMFLRCLPGSSYRR